MPMLRKYVERIWSAAARAARRAGCGTAFRAALKAASRVPRSGTLAARTPDPERLFLPGTGGARVCLPVSTVERIESIESIAYLDSPDSFGSEEN